MYSELQQYLRAIILYIYEYYYSTHNFKATNTQVHNHVPLSVTVTGVLVDPTCPQTIFCILKLHVLGICRSVQVAVVSEVVRHVPQLNIILRLVGKQLELTEFQVKVSSFAFTLVNWTPDGASL